MERGVEWGEGVGSNDSGILTQDRTLTNDLRLSSVGYGNRPRITSGFLPLLHDARSKPGGEATIRDDAYSRRMQSSSVRTHTNRHCGMRSSTFSVGSFGRGQRATPITTPSHGPIPFHLNQVTLQPEGILVSKGRKYNKKAPRQRSPAAITGIRNNTRPAPDCPRDASDGLHGQLRPAPQLHVELLNLRLAGFLRR